MLLTFSGTRLETFGSLNVCTDVIQQLITTRGKPVTNNFPYTSNSYRNIVIKYLIEFLRSKLQCTVI